MKTKFKLALVVATLLASNVVMAQPNGRGYNSGHNIQRGNTYVQNNYNRGGYNNYNRGYNYNRGGNGWGYAGAAIAGAIIGGAIANSYAQPYYAPAPVYVPPPTYYAPTYQPWHWESVYDPACACYRNIQVPN